MGYILLEGLEFYAYHGHFKEEQVVGNKFEVNLKVKANLAQAGNSDILNDTVDYQSIYRIISQEMEVASNLLEHVGGRIMRSLRKSFPELQEIELKISKLNPPMGGKMNCVSIIMNYPNDEN